jgi:uncharacterized membrane protein YgaE (UPF0421/DUF939 family)
MLTLADRHWLGLNASALKDSARTAIAALISLIVARFAGLPEAYWAPIVALIIVQSTLGAALKISGQRLVATAIGAALGAFIATQFGPNIYLFAIGVLLTGLICKTLWLDTAYRYSAITLTIVMMIPRPLPPWIIALHRFAEVAIGIGAGLIATSVWPDAPDETLTQQ